MARSWPWIEAEAKTFLRLEKGPEHFQIKDLQFAVQLRYVHCVLSAKLLIKSLDYHYLLVIAKRLELNTLKTMINYNSHKS